MDTQLVRSLRDLVAMLRVVAGNVRVESTDSDAATFNQMVFQWATMTSRALSEVVLLATVHSLLIKALSLWGIQWPLSLASMLHERHCHQRGIDSSRLHLDSKGCAPRILGMCALLH